MLKSVWERYCTFLGDFDLEPGIYKGQRFKTKLEKFLQGKAMFVKSLKPTDSIMIFTEMTAGTALLNMKTLMDDKQDDAKGMTMASCGTDKETEILSWLYRVSVKVKADIRESPRHDVIGGIDQHHAEKTVPDVCIPSYGSFALMMMTQEMRMNNPVTQSYSALLQTLFSWLLVDEDHTKTHWNWSCCTKLHAQRT